MNTLLTDSPRRPVPVQPTGPDGQELARFLETLNACRMGLRLQEAFRGGPPTCHVLDAKYEPGLRAIVLYEHGGGFVRGDLVSHADGDGSSAVSAPGVRLSRFPFDPEMPTLPSVMDPAQLGPALAAALAGASYRLSGSGARPRLRLLRYRPGKRATVLVSFPGESTRFVAKVYHDPVKAAAVADEAPHLASIAHGGSLNLPPTVAHLAALNVVVQGEVSGTPLDALLAAPSSEAARAGVAAAGRALAELHQAEAVTGRQRSVEKELHRFRSRAARIASVDPGAGTVLGRLADRLLELYDGLPAARTGPVHGDCKPSQFLCAGQRVYLMDLDHVGVSDQAVDVGTFLATLRQLALRRSMSRSRAWRTDDLVPLADEFLDSYHATRGQGPDSTRIRWQEAVALQRKALRAFARAPRSPFALALAAEADRCLDRMVETA